MKRCKTYWRNCTLCHCGPGSGAIIEQDVERVNHDFTVDQLREVGRDVERNVMARAVKWHLEDRIIVDGNKTVVFPIKNWLQVKIEKAYIKYYAFLFGYD